jgi:hypothetical protein
MVWKSGNQLRLALLNHTNCMDGFKLLELSEQLRTTPELFNFTFFEYGSYCRNQLSRT